MSRYDGTSKEQHKHRKRSRSRSIERSGYGEVDRREVSSQRDKERSKPESDDGDFNFLHYKQSLNKIFFRDQNVIRRGTKEYDDFWVFVEKYQIFQKRQPSKPCASSSSDKESRLGIPSHYDKRYRINVGLVNRDVEDFLKKGRLADADIDRRLTKDRVREFRAVMLHYLDFQQKQKLAKLKKVRTDQENLPIYQFKQHIIETVSQHQVIIIAGDTGCGKSTQVPQYLLQAGFTNIACTQPRRIACVSLSKRVGYETLNEFGTEVAFQVRFEKTKTRNTKILFLTEGLLLRQMTTDPHLSMYNVIVIDEVHERHIHTDYLLGVLQCLVRHRDDVKVILMSATINIELFSNYFHEAPVIQVPGRLYPIEMEFCPIQKDYSSSRSERLDPTPYLRIMQRIEKKYPKSERGDMLIFLSGLSEIMSVVEAARALAQQTKSWIILPLHSGLSVDEQEKVFDIAPEGVRKCIVSTNIAETSVTIDGVRFIVDSGKVKEMSFDPKYKMQRLQEFWISRASAEQRKGRAGRTGPGQCFRLYEEREYEAFQEYTTPEIRRVPLDSLVLQMISMGLPDPRKFPFIEPPSLESLDNAVIFLRDQGALHQDESLTPIGLMLSKLPVDVVIGKMLIMGSIFHMIDPVLSIAAAMSVQSPFTSKIHTDVDSMAARKTLESDHGDPFTLLNAFDEWIQVKAEGRGTKKWCQRRGLEEQRFYEMTKLKRQFKDLLQDHGLLMKAGEGEEYLSSAERRQKHGERKRLSQLRREQRNESKKRKVLKLDQDDYQLSDGDDDDKDSDIKDLEFRLSHNLQQLQETSNESRRFTLRDVNLLKIILCSGLYPQVSVADDCNTLKSSSEQAFHTKSKPFLLLHPTSVFSYKPELLHPKHDLDAKHDPADLKGVLSNKHELLTYVSILETNKPYLINTMRVPALQTVTLFSNAIDTNSTCTRLICDGWLELVIPEQEEAQEVMSSVIQLRATWQNLLKLRLEDTFLSMESERQVSGRSRKLERILAAKLTEFLSSDVRYKLRRVLAAEMKNVYVGPDGIGESPENILPASSEGSRPHPIKGGIQMNEYLTHGCLVDDGTASVVGEFTVNMQRHWACPRCNESMVVSIAERLEHEAACQAKNITATKTEIENELAEEREGQLNPHRKSYFCADCDKQLSLSVIEILKHKKSHRTGT
ncbi:probable ATP-dependent RNA helicase DHX34 [Mya arenaria]|uniref:probable ATP-dependent RNA helicase DHX34 n=1 Tax=Mya arenaria TaxID=6604 RepID=UPI0022DECF3A|nr:probable ATP-dependent RNA helicase DHX34 [Mya arenaria]